MSNDRVVTDWYMEINLHHFLIQTRIRLFRLNCRVSMLDSSFICPPADEIQLKIKEIIYESGLLTLCDLFSKVCSELSASEDKIYTLEPSEATAEALTILSHCQFQVADWTSKLSAYPYFSLDADPSE